MFPMFWFREERGVESVQDREYVKEEDLQEFRQPRQHLMQNSSNWSWIRRLWCSWRAFDHCDRTNPSVNSSSLCNLSPFLSFPKLNITYLDCDEGCIIWLVFGDRCQHFRPVTPLQKAHSGGSVVSVVDTSSSVAKGSQESITPTATAATLDSCCRITGKKECRWLCDGDGDGGCDDCGS